MSMPTTPRSLYLTHSLNTSSLNWSRPRIQQSSTRAVRPHLASLSLKQGELEGGRNSFWH